MENVLTPFNRWNIAGSVLSVVLALNSGNALAQASNDPPPSGAILDLGGAETGTAAQLINHGAPVTETATVAA